MRISVTVVAALAAAGLAWAAAQGAINATCPVKGEAIKPAITTKYKGKTIAFC